MNIKGIEIKRFKELKNGHGDSRTFEAFIYMDGKKIGHTSNNGWGGCNEYWFIPRESGEEFYRRSKVWGEETGHTFESSDSLIEELIELMSEEKAQKAFAKKGFPVTLVCFKNKETIGTSSWWGEKWAVGFKKESQIAGYIHKEKVEYHKVLK